jgi:FkbM family methyltransferase
MKALLKSLAAKLPLTTQQALKRYYFARQIRQGQFFTDEKEFELAGKFIGAGDWVLDIGANIGHYTRKFSDLVGPTGRVIAFEPVPRTFELLSANAQHFPNRNVTLMNVAASDGCHAVGMQMPAFESGLSNYYQARIAKGQSDLQVLTLAVDSIPLPHAVKLVKMDVEGHELAALAGMRSLLARDRPTLIVEASSPAIGEMLKPLGYDMEHIENSSNYIFRSLR